MNWIKTITNILPEQGKDIFFYDEDAGFLAGYLDEQDRFICRADGFSYDNVTHWAYASLESDFNFEVEEILKDLLINKRQLARRLWPEKSQPEVRLNQKIKEQEGYRLTENDIELVDSFLKKYFKII